MIVHESLISQYTKELDSEVKGMNDIKKQLETGLRVFWLFLCIEKNPVFEAEITVHEVAIMNYWLLEKYSRD